MDKYTVGCGRSVVWLLYNEELSILEVEVVLFSICAALEVFPGTEEEEESDPGEVTDGDVPWGDAWGGGVQGLDYIDWERPHSGWRGVFLLI